HQPASLRRHRDLAAGAGAPRLAPAQSRPAHRRQRAALAASRGASKPWSALSAAPSHAAPRLGECVGAWLEDRFLWRGRAAGALAGELAARPRAGGRAYLDLLYPPRPRWAARRGGALPSFLARRPRAPPHAMTPLAASAAGAVNRRAKVLPRTCR